MIRHWIDGNLVLMSTGYPTHANRSSEKRDITSTAILAWKSGLIFEPGPY